MRTRSPMAHHTKKSLVFLVTTCGHQAPITIVKYGSRFPALRGIPRCRILSWLYRQNVFCKITQLQGTSCTTYHSGSFSHNAKSRGCLGRWAAPSCNTMGCNLGMHKTCSKSSGFWSLLHNIPCVSAPDSTCHNMLYYHKLWFHTSGNTLSWWNLWAEAPLIVVISQCTIFTVGFWNLFKVSCCRTIGHNSLVHERCSRINGGCLTAGFGHFLHNIPSVSVHDNMLYHRLQFHIWKYSPSGIRGPRHP